MCVGVPMMVEALRGAAADCVARGCRRSVSLLLLEPGSVGVGDHVLVHQGMAVRSLDPEEAALIWVAFDLVLSQGSPVQSGPPSGQESAPTLLPFPASA